MGPAVAYDLDALATALADTPSENERRQLLDKMTVLQTAAGIELLYSHVLKVAYEDRERAERLAQVVQWVANRRADPLSRAFALRCSGHMLFARADYPGALECYGEALRLLESAGEEVEVGRTLTTGLQVLIYLSRYDEALDWASRAREIFARHGDTLRLARLASNMGNILYRQDRHREAVTLYEQAHAQLDRLGEPRDIAAVLSNMAVCYSSLSEYSLALQTYQKAREYCARHGFDRLTADANYNMACLHRVRGDYGKALDLYQQSRAHFHSTGDAYHEALCDLDESEVYLELNLSEEGERLAESASRKFQQLHLGYEHAKALVGTAVAANHRGNNRRTLKLLRAARHLFVGEGNEAWPAVIDLYQALVHHQLGQRAKAARLAAEAHSRLAELALPARTSLCELLQAQLLRESGRYGDARSLCQAAIQRLIQADSRPLLFQACMVRGQIEEDSGDLESAYRSYQDARSEAQNLLSRVDGEQMQISFLKDKLAVYESLVSLSLEHGLAAGSPQQSFQYIEEAKSRKLADVMAVSARSGGPPQDDSLAARIQILRRELDWHYRQIDLAALRKGRGRSRAIDDLKRQARQREKEVVQTVARFRSVDREMAVLIGEGTLSLESIRACIPSDAALLQYFQIRGVIHAGVLSQRKLEFFPLASSSTVRKLLRMLQFHITKHRLGPGYRDTFGAAWKEATEAHLRELYDKLIAPFRKSLDAAHLIVAPHGFLHHVPFHALHDGSEFLIDRFTVSYTPSGSVYALCCSRRQFLEDRSLVLGVPDNRAPHIEQEARTVASMLPNASLYLGDAATQELLRQAGNHCRFVHIATHGMFRPDSPMFSSIRLGDGQLSLFDLYQLPLSAGLVTLSGCSTGLNVVVGGDELFGLMRGLLSAGANSILVSLWDVSDRTTADFMRAFYRSLTQHWNKAMAVREGMRSVRAEHPHPFFWAPFAVVGKYAN